MKKKKINPNAKPLQQWREIYRATHAHSTEVDELMFAATMARENLLLEPPALVEYIIFNY
jgi:hypothetical protein